MGVRNELVQSVGKGQVHADSLSLAPSPFPFPPQLQSTLPPSPPPRLPASRVQRQSGERLLFLLLLNIQLEKLGRFFLLFFSPPALQFDTAG